MRVRLLYGEQGLEIELPDGSDVILPKESTPLADPEAALREALARPIGSAPLCDLVQADDRVTIVFSDLTRPAPNRLLAPALLRVVEEAGVPRDRITLLVGTGLHRQMSAAELKALLGPEVANSYRVVVHDARDPDSLTFLRRYPGERRGGIYLNSAYLQASVRIVTGFVEPHIFAGYSGGGKGVLPGVAAAPNIMRNHSAENLLHPQATFCVGAGNPIFEEMREVAVASEVTFLCNVTLTADKAVSGFFCGDLVEAHEAAMAEVDRSAVRPVPHVYDIVVGTNGGYPADLNVYQSIKGMAAAARAVREGGAIVLASECREGVGNEDYAEFLSSRESPEALMAMLLEPGFHRIDQWGIQCQAMAQLKAEVHLYSSLEAETVRAAHLTPCEDVSATVAELARRVEEQSGKRAKVLALPSGFQAIPAVQAE